MFLFMKLPRCPFLWFQSECLFCVANFLERRQGWATSLPSPLSLQRHSLWGWKQPFHVEASMGPRPAFRGFPIGQSQGGWRELEALGWRLRQEEVVLGFAPVPNHPNQSSRGPPCGASPEQPHKWCPAPTLFP